MTHPTHSKRIQPINVRIERVATRMRTRIIDRMPLFVADTTIELAVNIHGEILNESEIAAFEREIDAVRLLGLVAFRSLVELEGAEFSIDWNRGKPLARIAIRTLGMFESE